MTYTISVCFSDVNLPAHLSQHPHTKRYEMLKTFCKNFADPNPAKVICESISPVTTSAIIQFDDNAAVLYRLKTELAAEVPTSNNDYIAINITDGCITLVKNTIPSSAYII